MPNPINEEFNNVNKLIEKGKREEALEIVKKFAWRAWNLNNQGDNDKALNIALSCEKILTQIGSQSHVANNYAQIGWFYRDKDKRKAMEFAKKSLKIHEKLGNQRGIAECLSLQGHLVGDQGSYDEALELINQSLSIKEISPLVKLQNLSNMASGNVVRGELSEALKYCEKGIEFAIEYNLIGFCPYLLYSKGIAYFMKGDYEKAENCEKKSLILAEKLDLQSPLRGIIILVLIWLQLSKNLDNIAKEYLSTLKKLAYQKEDKDFEYIVLTAEGLILQKSNRLQDRAKAEKYLKKVVESESIDTGFSRLFINPFALYFLCDFLIEELGRFNDIRIIDDLNTYISRLDDLGEKHNLHLIHTEAKIFRARLALIQLNLGEARNLLTQAQQMAETHNLQYFAQIISNNHDRLLEQQELLEQLKRRNAPISERLEYASFDSVLARLKGKYSTESSELINELPVLLLIISKGGTLIFSKSYSDKLTVDSDLISSFLSAFESFGDELFSERLDRIKYGDNTILIKPLENFSVCYLFKGQSYPALQKLTRFTEAIRENSEIWQVLNKSVETSEMLETNKVPAIKSVIDEIF